MSSCFTNREFFIPLHTLTFFGSTGDLSCNCCQFFLHHWPCPHEFASSSVANTKRLSFFKRKTDPFSSQVSDAHYLRLLATLPQLSWPANFVIRVCTEILLALEVC